MNYLICSTGRARSGVLASYLRQLKIGSPDEFYEKLRFVLWTMDTPEEVKGFLEAHRVNGIFGMRMVWSHVRTMHNTLGLTIQEFIGTYIPNPKYIFMKRDPIKQAVESVMYGMRKDGKPFESKYFDLDAARKRMTRIVVGNTAWQMFFEKHNITPIHIDANLLELNPVEELRSLLIAMELPYNDVPVINNHFRDDLMNDFRDKMCMRFLGRHAQTMDDIDVQGFL